ncbi:hypothetical protein HELRODRAFT_160941 [Helobdella robusta]|uniref:Peptidase A2 domain-containing protein n=1 Tax=Helobdella robusta TaxID=6412 RepID=T1EQW0_HELRO|nr:hypothetical protein HELRODRAFT_160941 [Helobdella robusta]ESO01779.1 hypothetical protein HELRODRAFT_160941 [Helobdella robusta]
MDVEKDLLIVDEVGVSSQQAGREQTSARPVFSDPERVYCRVADPGQERLRRSEGSSGYSYADAVRDRVVRNSNVARRNIQTLQVLGAAGAKDILGFRCQGDPKLQEFGLNELRLASSRSRRNKILGNCNRCRATERERDTVKQKSTSDSREPLHSTGVKSQVHQPRIGAERDNDFSRRELLRPDRFDGTGCLKTFLKKFEICARYNNWNLVDMEAYLSCSLTGEAAQVLWDLTGLGYQELVSKLEDRFGTRGHEESYRYELQILRRKPGESLRELSMVTKRLMSLAYPGEQSKLATHLARDFFLSALDNAELEFKVREKEPKNIKKRLKIFKQGQKTWSQWYDRLRSFKSHSKNSEIKECSQRYPELSERKFVLIVRSQIGHFVRECPQKGMTSSTVDYVNKSIESNDRVMYLPSTINGKRRLGLLDSGSSVSIVPTSMVDVTKIRPTKKRLKAVNNTKIPVKGEMKLQIKVDDYSKSALVLVSDHVSEIVLGLDWLRNNHISWKKLCRIEAHTEVRIPAQTELDVPAKMIVRQPSKLESTGFMCSENRQIESGVYVARTLLLIKYEGQCVRILNVNDQPGVIKRRTRLPDLSSAVEAKESVDRLAYENLTEVTGMVDGLVKDFSKKAREELIQILKSFSDRFSCASGEIGAAKGVFHKIDTQDARPVKQQLRRHTPAHQKVIAEQTFLVKTMTFNTKTAYLLAEIEMNFEYLATNLSCSSSVKNDYEGIIFIHIRPAKTLRSSDFSALELSFFYFEVNKNNNNLRIAEVISIDQRKPQINEQQRMATSLKTRLTRRILLKDLTSKENEQNKDIIN